MPSRRRWIGRGSLCALFRKNCLSSKFIREDEFPYLLERRERDGLLFLPVLAMPCAWKEVRWLNRIQKLPPGDKYLGSYKDELEIELALTEIAEYVSRKFKDPSFTVSQPPPKWPTILPEHVYTSVYHKPAATCLAAMTS